MNSRNGYGVYDRPARPAPPTGQYDTHVEHQTIGYATSPNVQEKLKGADCPLIAQPKMTSDSELELTPAENEPKKGCLSSHYHKYKASITEKYPEVTGLLFLAGPVEVMLICQVLIPAEAVVFCGHMSRAVLGGCTLANLFISIFGTLTGQGIATASDTLFSRSYGNKDTLLMRRFFYQGLQIMFLAALMISAVFFVMDRILIMAGHDADMAVIAGQYLVIYSPAIFMEYCFTLVARYFQCQDYVRVPTIAAIFGNLLHILLQTIVISGAQGGFRAAAAVQATSMFAMVLMLLGYAHVSKMLQFNFEEFRVAFRKPWTSFLKLAIPGFLLIVLENLCFRIGTITSGYIGPCALDAQAVINQIEGLCYTLHASIGIAISIRVARHLGANAQSEAQKTCNTGIATGLVVAVLLCCLVGSLGKVLPLVFTSDSEVIKLAVRSVYLLLPMQIVDAFSATCSGALRGCARHKLTAGIIFFGFYIIALPAGIILMFPLHQGIGGLWGGMIIGLFVISIIFFYILWKTDWQEQSEKAQETLHKEMQKISSMSSSLENGEGFMELDNFGDEQSCNEAAHSPRKMLLTPLFVYRLKCACCVLFVCMLIGAILLRELLPLPKLNSTNFNLPCRSINSTAKRQHSEL